MQRKDFQTQLRLYRDTKQFDWGSEQFYKSTATRKGQGCAARVAVAFGGLGLVALGCVSAASGNLLLLIYIGAVSTK